MIKAAQVRDAAKKSKRSSKKGKSARQERILSEISSCSNQNKKKMNFI